MTMNQTVPALRQRQGCQRARGTVCGRGHREAGVTRFRRSVTGQPRGPLCGMGICMECCVTINGRPHCRSCQTLCRKGWRCVTDE